MLNNLSEENQQTGKKYCSNHRNSKIAFKLRGFRLFSLFSGQTGAAAVQTSWRVVGVQADIWDFLCFFTSLFSARNLIWRWRNTLSKCFVYSLLQNCVQSQFWKCTFDQSQIRTQLCKDVSQQFGKQLKSAMSPLKLKLIKLEISLNVSWLNALMKNHKGRRVKKLPHFSQ